MRNPLTLAIAHSLFITRDQRYDLHSGKSIKTIGASLPVWFYKGKTSEPAEEVFCKYTINNKKGDASIIKRNNAYIINLPQVPEDYQPPSLSDDVWRKMTEKQRSEWYEKHPSLLSSKSLLDLKDGGCEVLNFRLQKQTKIKKKKVDVIHFVLMKTSEDLTNSLMP